MSERFNRVSLGTAFNRARISRVLVSVLVLTLVQTLGGVVISPLVMTPQATAANSSIIQTNLALDANATAGVNDVNTQMTLINTPTYTNSGVGYYTFNNTGIATTSQKYAYKNLDFSDRANVSIFMWVYPTAAGVILSHSGQVDPFTGYRLTTFDYTSAGKFEVGLYNSGPISTASTSLTTPLNNWYYLGLTYDGATIRGYLNGKLFNTASMANWTTSASDFFHIGTSQNGTCFSVACSDSNAASFRMGEFTVYRSTLSASDVLANFGATVNRFGPTIGNPSNQSTYVNKSATFSIPACTGTTSGSATCNYQWQLSTNGGISYTDISGATSVSYSTPTLSGSYDGFKYRIVAYDPGSSSPTSDALYSVSTPATLTVSASLDSDTDTALSLSGSQYLSSVQESPFDIATGTTFTLEAWVKPTITNANQILIGKNSQYSLYIYQNGSYGMNFYTTNAGGTGGDTSIFRAGSVLANQWQHVAVVRNGTSVTGYVNGQALATFTNPSATDAITAGSSPFVVGGYSTTNQTFTGQIDQVRVWSSARTAAEIQSGMSSFIPATQTGLIASYGFNELTGAKIFNNVTSSTLDTDLDLNGGSSTWSQIAETSTVGAYSIVTFRRSYLTTAGGWKAPSGVNAASVLVLAGGGAGGTRGGGGGGAGGYILKGQQSVSSTRYETITVGQGGVAQLTTNGSSGQDSIFGATITAAGGGSGGGAIGSDNTYRAGINGGSGGGAAGASGVGSAAYGYGNTPSTSPSQGNNGGSGNQGTNQWPGGGGGGITSAGANGSGNVAGTGGGGIIDPLSSSSVCFATGGGGGIYVGLTAGAGGNCSGIASPNNNQGTAGSSTPTPAKANTGSGGGGSGWSGSADQLGGDGGSGIIVIRWITASKPSYTKPTTAYLNVGMTETFTTNVAVDSATTTLTRTFLWESSTTGAGGPFTRIKSGTGAANAAFSWVPSDTSTSGSNYLYRLTVTDSDTVGLFITDSSTAFAVINGTLVMTGNSSIQTTLGKAYSETYTVTQGTIPYTHTLSPTTTGVTLDTTTVGSPVVKLASTLTVGSYPETLTVTDSVTATVTKALSLTVNPNPTISPPTINADNPLVNLNSAESASYSGSGSTWSDLSGNGKNASLGIISGGPLANGIAATCTAPTYSSASGGIFNFDGVNNCAYISTLASLDTFTVEMWVKSNGNQINNTGLIFTPYSSGENINFGVYFDNSGNIYATTSLSGTSATTPSTPFASGAWIHVAVVSSGRTLTLYLNGVSKSSVSLSFSPAGVSKGVFIGRSGGAGINFNGSISMVKIGSSGYSATQIQQNYYITSGRYSTTAIGVATVNSKYGVSTSQAFTVNNGTGNKRFTATPNNRVGISWDTATVNSATLSLAATLTPGTYYETLTATDSVSATSSVALTLLVAKADSITVTTTLSSSSVTYTESPANVTVTQTITGLVNSETGTATTTYTGTTCEYGGSCKIGDVAPGGGYVFYVSATAINAASGISDGGIYLATAPQTWSGGTADPTASFGCNSTNISGTSSSVGTGAENTRLINAGCATAGIASKLAADSSAEGFTDWFMPSIGELNLIRSNLKLNSLSNLNGTDYWSSTQDATNPSTSAQYQYFTGGSFGPTDKNNNLSVRPIRAFSPTALASNTTPTDAGVYRVGSTFAISSPATLSNYQGVESVTATLTINKARQKAITIGQYDAYPGISSYPLNVYGGSGPGTLTRTLVSAGTAGCSLASSFILTATSVGTCTVKAEKAGTRNYIVESTTATIYWITLATNYATQTLGGNHAIPLNGGNQIVVRTETLTASAFSNTSGGAITSAAVGTTIRINSTGFAGLTPSSLSVTFKPYEDAVITDVTSTYVEVVIPTGATTGVIIVDSPRGVVYTQSFTISP